MTDLADLLAGIRQTADSYGAEAARMAADDVEHAGRGQSGSVSVTVSGSGRLTGVETSGSDATPTRWRAQFTTAYEQALSVRTPAPATPLVPGVPAPRGARSAMAAEAEASRRADEVRIEAWAGVAERVPDVTAAVLVDGVTVTVNGMLLIVEVAATRTALASGVADAAVLAAYGQACDAVSRRLDDLVEVAR